MSAECTVFRLLLLLLLLLVLLIYRCFVLSERNRLSDGKTNGKISLIDSITESTFAFRTLPKAFRSRWETKEAAEIKTENSENRFHETAIYN